MEPRPRGITPDNHTFSQPPWLAQASQEYRKITGNSYTETSFFRGNASIEVLDRILPKIPHRPNILLVGLGLDTEPLLCTYEPFRVAAHLQGKGVDYAMTLVDVDQAVINEIKGRKRLFLSYKQYGKDLADSFEKAWTKYLADTKQQGRETFEIEEGLNFIPFYLNENAMVPYTAYLKHGIAVAEVSPQFQTKLTTGEITLVHDDIAVAPINETGPYNYVELTNVLYLMPEQGQQLALANVARSMAVGGRMLMNDIGGYTGRPVLTRLGGWLDSERLGQLGLEVEEVMSSKDTSETVLLRRTDGGMLAAA